jgi:hypothetical protein
MIKVGGGDKPPNLDGFNNGTSITFFTPNQNKFDQKPKISF